MARRRNDSSNRTADGSRRTKREKWKCVVGGVSGFDGGANRSERVPVERRAIVLVNAMMETWVSGRPAGGSRDGSWL